MAKYGYARVSSVDQNLDEQIEQLQRVGCDIIRQEKVSGRSIDDRIELKTLLEFLRRGDELWVTRVDRLARSVLDLSNIVNMLKEKGVILKAVQQQIDTSTASGSAFLAMLGVFAQFENDLRRERQLIGIARARAAGKYEKCGRPQAIDPAIAAKEFASMGASKAARKLKISRSTVYRSLEAVKSSPKPAVN